MDGAPFFFSPAGQLIFLFFFHSLPADLWIPPYPSSSSSSSFLPFLTQSLALEFSPFTMANSLRQRPGRVSFSIHPSSKTSSARSHARSQSVSHSQSIGPDTYIEVESSLLHNMQGTLEDSISKTNETVAATWRSTKATANETIKVVETQMSETWDASKAAFEGAKRLLRFEELPKEWQSNPYILTG